MSFTTPNRFAHPVFALALCLAFLIVSATCGAAPHGAGASIYQEKCASCHGADGQGVSDGHDEPLLGDDSVDDLARVIERTMPEEDPESCVGDDALQVARYIYHDFYSAEARRKKGLVAPRVELVRLTVPQYRNAVADLIGYFTPAPRTETRRRGRRGQPAPPTDDSPPKSPEPGLLAEYYQSKGMNKADNLGRERTDRRIVFDYGEGSPVESITADQFSIIWQGAVTAGDTGHYEFRVRTQNGARLYLNRDQIENRRKLRDDSSAAGQAALIDGWVSSGKMRELTARVFLLGGRQYPFRLEFFKYLEKTASIKLEWKPPHGSWAVLDDSHLTTARVARVFVADAPLPADDRSLGYERGSSVSREWHAMTTNAAVAAAAEVVGRLPLLAKLDEDNSGREEQLNEFVVRFASVAFRRPLTNGEDQLFRQFPFSDPSNAEAAVRRAILFILTSPHFLYTDLTPAGQTPSQHAIASRLSFALWDSIPDEPLFEAAGNGQLRTAEQIEAQARRMIADPRARAKMREFFHHWLELEERDLAKDKEMFPEFDEAVIADLRYSLELFLEQVVWTEQSDYRQLLLADFLVLNDRLRALYQPETQDESDPAGSITEAGKDASVQPAAKFQNVTFSPDRRAGVLTHPYLLSAFSYHNNTSPIHRGVFLTRNIVGRALKPPPAAVAFKDNEFSPDLTMREKVTQLTRDRACMSCHSVINPLGFALENYDPVGRWRTNDKDKPVDTRSEYTTVEGKTLEVGSARDVADFAVASETAHRAFITQLFHHSVKQPPSAYGPNIVDELRARFADDNFNIRNLWARMAVLSATHGHTTTPPHESDS